MPSKLPEVKGRVTPAQRSAVNRAAKAIGMSKADFIRTALALYCAKLGIVWPDDEIKHGGRSDMMQIGDDDD